MSLAWHFAGAEVSPTPATPLAVTGPNDHANARRVLATAFRQVVGREPSAAEIQGVQAVALHETGYGALRPFPGSHNWGAVQVPGTWGAAECPPNGFLGHDSTPNPDGSSTFNTVCFRSYEDDVAGAVDVVRNLTTARPRTLRALATGDADQIAGAMYAERYYTGAGATPAARVAGYASALARRASQIAAALGEALRVRRHQGGDGGSIALPLAALLGFGVLSSRFHVGAPLYMHHGDVEIFHQWPKSASFADRLGNAACSSSSGAHLSYTGDLLPTFVSPADARAYIQETDTQYTRIDQEIQASSVSPEFKTAWATVIEGWRRYRDEANRNVSLLNTKATMEQTDRWATQLHDWTQQFALAGGKLAGPAPPAAGQGVDSQASKASAGWVQMALIIAGLFGAGYMIRALRGV